MIPKPVGSGKRQRGFGVRVSDPHLGWHRHMQIAVDASAVRGTYAIAATASHGPG